ncbi:unnamed protein product [Callosobruchus maculatus]|uniref:Uncharacterized protein n=1 Tax=Callosobruchus maculatus TaxID=64391 RepID=A0A653DS70_CALMS|nr:unnamed protein product [Callosobruchus maculatus]
MSSRSKRILELARVVSEDGSLENSDPRDESEVEPQIHEKFARPNIIECTTAADQQFSYSDIEATATLMDLGETYTADGSSTVLELEVGDDGILRDILNFPDEVTSSPGGNYVNDATSLSFVAIAANSQEGLECESSSINEAKKSTEDVIGKAENKTRKKRRQIDVQEWECNKNKRLRALGQEYKGLGKENGKWQYIKKRNSRLLKESCKCYNSQRKSKILCTAITEHERKSIYSEFWRMTWEEKKIYVKTLVDIKYVSRRKSTGEDSRRNNSLFCYLKPPGRSEKIRVCKKQFLNTLCLGEWTVLNWVKENLENTENDEQNLDSSYSTKKLPKRQSNVKSREKDFLLKFFDKLPKLESHYCRASTSKIYFEPIWKSKQELYRFYVEECKAQDVSPLSTASFANIFLDKNYSLFTPKKDQCDICLGFKYNHISEDKYRVHLEKKNLAREEKSRDKEKEKWIFTMDLQSVLMCPLSKASKMYYKSKLVLHNFTIFNLKNSDGFCYLWHEGQGGMSSNEFATILSDFVMALPTEEGDSVIFYSDGCTYQNRNVIISNMFLYCSQVKKITIYQKFLEKGHTQMECDSMHSVIERKLRNTEVFLPADYASLIKSARINPRPYQVKYLKYDYFKDFSKRKCFKSIRPGYKAGDPQVTDLRCLRYSPDGLINYKLSFNDPWCALENRKMDFDLTAGSALPQLYKQPLPIDKKKFNNLQALKTVMDAEYHSFYDNLPYK